MVQSVAGSCTIVLIAHRLSTVMGADKLVVIHDKRVHEVGTHVELLENDKLYARLVRKQNAKEAQQLHEDVHYDSDSSGHAGKGDKGRGKGKKKGKGKGAGKGM